VDATINRIQHIAVVIIVIVTSRRRRRRTSRRLRPNSTTAELKDDDPLRASINPGIVNITTGIV